MKKTGALALVVLVLSSLNAGACGYGNIEKSVSCTIGQAVINDGSGIASTVVNSSARYANTSAFKTESAVHGVLRTAPARDGSTIVTLQVNNADNGSNLIDASFPVRFRETCDGSDIVYTNTVVTPIYYAVVEVNVVCSAEVRFDRD